MGWNGTCNRGNASAEALRFGNLDRHGSSSRVRQSSHHSRYLVHHHLVGDAAQRRFLPDRLDRLLLRMAATAGESITGPVTWISWMVDRLCTRAAILTVWPK